MFQHETILEANLEALSRAIWFNSQTKKGKANGTKSKLFASDLQVFFGFLG